MTHYNTQVNTFVKYFKNFQKEQLQQSIKTQHLHT